MSTFRFPNESDEYRAKRDELLDAEVALRAQVEAVAELRRQLPLGGGLKEDYVFERVGDGGAVEEVAFADLFGPHDELLVYSMMYGQDWDAPCPACTSIVDACNACCHSVAATCAIAVVAGAGAEQLHAWAGRRGWRIPLVSGVKNDYLLDYCGHPDTKDKGMVSVMNSFRRTADGIFHFWASEMSQRPMDNGHPRHVDSIWPLWNLLDMTQGGRGDAIVPAQNYEHAYFTKTVLGQG